jgi:hypothetical protein
MTIDEIHALSDADLATLAVNVRHEQALRRIPTVMATLNDSYLTAKGIVPGQEWVQPTAAFDAYPLYWQVTHNTKTWESLVASNVWEPGVANWREVVDPTAPPPDFVQPTGSTDAYMTGDKVTFNGVVYTSLIDNNVWSPADYPTGWQADPPA